MMKVFIDPMSESTTECHARGPERARSQAAMEAGEPGQGPILSHAHEGDSRLVT